MGNTYGYIRVSTQEQSSSIDCQRSTIMKYCDLKGIELPEIIVDEGVSGTIPMEDRPNGKVLHGARDTTIIVTKLDRLFRSVSDYVKNVELWTKRDTYLVILDMGGGILDTSSPFGKCMLHMLVSFAQFERDMIGERVKAVLANKRANGQRVMRYAPYGSRIEGTQLVAEPAQQQVIKEIKLMAEAEYTPRMIVDELVRRKVPSARGGPENWTLKTVKNICGRS